MGAEIEIEMEDAVFVIISIIICNIVLYLLRINIVRENTNQNRLI